MSLDPCGLQCLQQPPHMMVSIPVAKSLCLTAAIISVVSTYKLTSPTCDNTAEQPGYAKAPVLRQEAGFQEAEGS